MKQLEDLKAKARAATPGPWKADTIENIGENWLVGYLMNLGEADNAEGGYSKWIVTTDRIPASQCHPHRADNDAAFIAAANPQVVEALCEVAQHCDEFVNGESVTYGEVRKALATLEQAMKESRDG